MSDIIRFACAIVILFQSIRSLKKIRQNNNQAQIAPSYVEKKSDYVVAFLFPVLFVGFLLFAVMHSTQCSNSKDPNIVISECNKAIAQNGGKSADYNTRGVAYMNKSDNDSALQDFERGLEIEQAKTSKNIENIAKLQNNIGLIYNRKNMPDKAIGFLNAAIENSPHYAHAYANRSLSYILKYDYLNAEKDADKALSLDSSIDIAHLSKGLINIAETKYNEAIADFDIVIKSQPLSQFYFMRSLAEFAVSSPQIYLDDMQKSINLGANDPLTILWLHIAKTRNHIDDTKEFENNIKMAEKDKWPFPLLSFYQDQITLEKLFSLSKNGPQEKLIDQACDANFYAAEYFVIKKQKEEAKTYFNNAFNICREIDFEKNASKIELNRL